MWETMAEKLVTTEEGEVCGVKVRNSDGKLRGVRGEKVMLACGSFEGNKELSVLLRGLPFSTNGRI